MSLIHRDDDSPPAPERPFRHPRTHRVLSWLATTLGIRNRGCLKLALRVAVDGRPDVESQHFDQNLTVMISIGISRSSPHTGRPIPSSAPNTYPERERARYRQDRISDPG